MELDTSDLGESVLAAASWAWGRYGPAVVAMSGVSRGPSQVVSVSPPVTPRALQFDDLEYLAAGFSPREVVQLLERVLGKLPLPLVRDWLVEQLR